MKKRFQKMGMFKIVLALLFIPLVLTNCQNEELSLNEENNLLDRVALVPSITEAQLNFNRFNTNGTSKVQKKNVTPKNKNFFVHWNKSEAMVFDEDSGIEFLYTPILFEKKNQRVKAFLASFKNSKFKVQSKMFSILYHDSNTNTALNGIIFEKDDEGNILKFHNYHDGILLRSYSVNTTKDKSKLASKQDGCELTEEDIAVILEMLEASGGGSINILGCVTITASSSDDPTTDYDFNNPDFGLPPVPDTLSGGSSGSSSTSSTTSDSETSETRDPAETDQWWHEDTNIDPLDNEISIALIEVLPPLTSEQKSYVNNPDNNQVNIQLLNFLQANGYSIEAEEFAIAAIDALIDGDFVNFEEFYIETDTPDDNFIFQGQTDYIPSLITWPNGDEVSVKFGITKSDGKSANQKVSSDLIDGLKFALERANSKLSGSDKINSIYIMSTTNGKHSSTSNHSNGTAIDISRINGNKMAISGLTNQIKQLQNAFDSYVHIRENFGPYFKHKYSKETGTWNYNYPVNGHLDHIHISIRK